MDASQSVSPWRALGTPSPMVDTADEAVHDALLEWLANGVCRRPDDCIVAPTRGASNDSHRSASMRSIDEGGYRGNGTRRKLRLPVGFASWAVSLPSPARTNRDADDRRHTAKLP
jgi:hypothetical protein